MDVQKKKTIMEYAPPNEMRVEDGLTTTKKNPPKLCAHTQQTALLCCYCLKFFSSSRKLKEQHKIFCAALANNRLTGETKKGNENEKRKKKRKTETLML